MDTQPRQSKGSAVDRSTSGLYTLHGQRMRVSGDADGAAFVGSLLAYKGAVREEEGSASPLEPTAPAMPGASTEAAKPLGETVDVVIDVQVTDGRAEPDVPAGAQSFERGARFWTWTTPDGPCVASEDSDVRIDLETGRVAMRLAAGALEASGRRTTGFYLLTTALLYVMAGQGRAALHAAALLPPSARELSAGTHPPDGLMLVAGSNSGKSTTALTLIRHGWGYVSDDTVLLRDASAGADVPSRDGLAAVLAYSYRRDACLDPDAATLFPELAERDWPPSPSDATKWRVDLDALYDDRFRPVCIPRVLLFPNLVPSAPSRLEPVGARTALHHLFRQSALPLLLPRPSDAQHTLDALTRLIGQSTCYRLSVGRDLLDPDTAHGLLAPLIGRDAVR